MLKMPREMWAWHRCSREAIVNYLQNKLESGESGTYLVPYLGEALWGKNYSVSIEEPENTPYLEEIIGTFEECDLYHTANSQNTEGEASAIYKALLTQYMRLATDFTRKGSSITISYFQLRATRTGASNSQPKIMMSLATAVVAIRSTE